MTIKTFRGLIPNGAQDIIVLHTNDGSTGYIIRSFRIIGADPISNEDEGVVKIYSTSQSTFTSTIDFNDQTLLAVGVWTSRATTRSYPLNEVIIFDNMVFNQDIYITSIEQATGNALNYYLELEQVKLDLNENTVATLKDIRNITAPQ